MTAMLSGEALLWVKALHVMAVIAWMAGLFYLPRLFVYHRDTEAGSALSETFKLMERRLLQAIMTPAMIAAWLLGLIQVYELWDFAPWLWIKLAAVIAMSAFHDWLSRLQKAFARDERPRDARFFRIINEVPTVLMVIIVIAVIVKPFS